MQPFLESGAGEFVVEGVTPALLEELKTHMAKREYGRVYGKYILIKYIESTSLASIST
jgi:hypothetical protein